MKIEESLGTLKEVFSKASPTSLPLIKAAHKYLIELAPDAVVVPRLGEKSIAYGVGVKKMSEAYCYLIPFKDYLNFGFYHGTDVDVDGILEGTGAKIRHIKIHSLDDLKNPKLKKLVLRAIKDRKAKVL
ncbi:MAG: hypothetical protein F2536_05625 [Actinobacteria bacterium]|uniref:Unannotated protein n=1 Tax=freshwater metagenome TaxID=449393 RepID=A0A6J6CK36_9ZZZZ|nr:hypothetical protein [Actinomycetota bacterium]